MQLKKISMPAPWKVNGNSKGVGGFQKPNFLNKSMTLKWNFRKGGGIQTKKPSVGGVWIFSGTIQSLRKLCILQIKVLVTRTVSHHVVNKINITHAAHDEMVAYVLVLNIQQLSCILIDRIFYRMV